jgi:isopentenyl-diphosphate delta-isomerase
MAEPDDDAEISDRKVDHLELTAREEVQARGKTTLLEQVDLLHDSLPELAASEVDLSTEFLGRTVQAPMLITGMTGGADRAREINRTLARVAQELGLAFGVGSQRALLEKPDELLETYQVREVAPDIALLGNLGAVQAAETPSEEVEKLVSAIGADALCIHLNPGQELIQPEGDRDFRGCLDAVARLSEDLDAPVIAKETGCGLSPQALDKLDSTGIDWVDTSGAGGTTWIGVETLRTPAEQRSVGDVFWDWGVPTAASVVCAKRRGFDTIASGGLRSGLDAARALALGADMTGMALPWLRAAYEEGYEAAHSFGETAIRSLRTACVLTSSQSLDELRETPARVGDELARWIRDLKSVSSAWDRD